MTTTLHDTAVETMAKSLILLSDRNRCVDPKTADVIACPPPRPSFDRLPRRRR